MSKNQENPLPFFFFYQFYPSYPQFHPPLFRNGPLKSDLCPKNCLVIGSWILNYYLLWKSHIFSSLLLYLIQLHESLSVKATVATTRACSVHHPWTRPPTETCHSPLSHASVALIVTGAASAFHPSCICTFVLKRTQWFWCLVVDLLP